MQSTIIPSNMINSFFHPENAYKQAGQEAAKGWQQSQNYQQPFWQTGFNQAGNLQGAENNLLHPETLENKWSSEYQTSPYAMQLQNQAKTSGLDAASSMGLLGSSTALNNIQSGATNIMNADRDKYMQDMMDKYMKGVGIGQNLYGTGATAGANLGAGAMQNGENMAGAKYGELSAPGNEMKDMLNMAMKAALAHYMPAG